MDYKEISKSVNNNRQDSTISPGTIKLLYEEAVDAMENSYTPESSFSVGAALLTENIDVFGGCNVETVSYSQTTHAEQTSFTTAVCQLPRGKPRSLSVDSRSNRVIRHPPRTACEGHQDFRLLLVVTDTEEPTPPCGHCRQIMVEFCDGDFPIVSMNLDGEWELWTLSYLLPEMFDDF